MTDYSELKRLAEVFPDYDWDSNTEPFFNGPSGESLGGGSTGFYCVYGPEFEIDGESYDGVTLVESCPADQAKFICKAKAGILALVAENDALRKDVERYQWLRERDLETINEGGVFAGMTPRNVVLNGQDLDEAIDAAMSNKSPPSP